MGHFAGTVKVIPSEIEVKDFVGYENQQTAALKQKLELRRQLIKLLATFIKSNMPI